MIGPVHDLRSRVLIGLGVLLAAVLAIGYGYVYLGIAQPPGGRVGIVTVPRAGTVVAATLDDGLPIFVTAVDGQAVVLDARAPHVAGEPDALVAWCDDGAFFLDPRHGGSFAPDGEALGASATTGLRRHAVEPIDGGRLAVMPTTTVAGGAPGERVAGDCGAGSSWTVHVAPAGEVFDPSVAADQEPEDWFWIEGRLEAVGDAVRVCDGLTGACDTFADVLGIDPATLQPASGMFLARVQDDALRDLVIVPDSNGLGGSS